MPSSVSLLIGTLKSLANNHGKKAQPLQLITPARYPRRYPKAKGRLAGRPDIR
jgi:hypothetical protein